MASSTFHWLPDKLGTCKLWTQTQKANYWQCSLTLPPTFPLSSGIAGLAAEQKLWNAILKIESKKRGKRKGGGGGNRNWENKQSEKLCNIKLSPASKSSANHNPINAIFFLSKSRTLQWLFLFLFRSSFPNRAFKPAEPGMQRGTHRTPFQLFQGLHWLHGLICVWHQLCFTPQTPSGNKWRSKETNRGDAYTEIFFQPYSGCSLY